MQPDPEDDAQLSHLVGSAPSPSAVVGGGLAMFVLWPLAKLVGALRRGRRSPK